MLKSKYNKYKTDSIEKVKPKLEPKLKEVAHLVSNAIIDKVVGIVSGSHIEDLFK